MTAAGEEYWNENPLNRPVGAAPEMTALRAAQPPSLDAGLEAWQAARALTMERYDDNPIRLRPEYQQVQAYCQWDPETLYLAFGVYDPEHFNNKEGEQIWDGDCVQVAIVKDRFWREFALALTPRGPQVFSWELKPDQEREYAYVGKGVPAGVKLNVAREADRTLYFMAIPRAELKSGPFSAGDTLRLNVAAFDRTREGFRVGDYVALAPGICGPKFVAPFARLHLINTAKDMQPVQGPQTSILPNGSFEQGSKTPDRWTPRGDTGGRAEWVDTEAGSGRHSLKLTIGPKQAAEWELGNFTGLKSGQAYTISARSKGNGKANFFRLRFYAGDKCHLVGLSAAPQWKKTSYTFSAGATTGGWLTIESCNWQGEGLSEVYVDDLILTESSAEPVALQKREVAVLTDSLARTTELSLRALYPARLKFFDVALPVDWKDVGAFDKLVIIPRDPAALKAQDWQQVKAFVAGGKTAVLDLAAYAALMGSPTNVIKVEVKTLSAVSPLAEFQKTDEAKRTKEAGAQAARAEEDAPAPLAVVTADTELSAGYPTGSEVPWFGRLKDQFVQRQIAPDALPQGATVVAKSNLGGGAVWLQQRIGTGRLYAVDINSLDEMTMQWSERGSYNKYAPIQNALGHGLRYGRYFNRRLTYEQYLEQLRALAAKYPALKLTVEGFRNGFNRYALCLGNPKGPVYIYTGMMHCQNEYRSGMYGLSVFAEYLGRHAQESPLKERLEKIAVKIVPVVSPELYVGNDNYDTKGNEQPLPLTKWNGDQDDIRLAIQQHHGVGQLLVGFGYSLGHGTSWAVAIHKYATQVLYDTPPTVYWDLDDPANTGPQPINRVSGVGPNPPGWDAYFELLPHYTGLAGVNREKLRAASLNILSEHTVYGTSPAFGDFTVPVREFHSALMTDQSVSFLLAALLVEEPGPGPAKEQR